MIIRDRKIQTEGKPLRNFFAFAFYNKKVNQPTFEPQQLRLLIPPPPFPRKKLLLILNFKHWKAFFYEKSFMSAEYTFFAPRLSKNSYLPKLEI